VMLLAPNLADFLTMQAGYRELLQCFDMFA
jgi:predicted component of viral defense system (DUF524 family)